MSKKTTREHVLQIGGLFSSEDRKRKLAEFATPLDKLDASMDWERFRAILEGRIPHRDRRRGGRPPFDPVFMFKILVLRTYYGLSDERTEIDILDRHSFQRFLGLENEGRVPERTSIRNFREALGAEGVGELFACFDGQLRERGLLARKGKTVDASFVDAPRQRDSREENARIKAGEGAPEDWSEAKRARKDVDARWTKKNNETHYGYKNHIKADRKTKLVESYEATDASVHDSQALEALIEEGDGEIYADSAYRSEEIGEQLRERKIRDRIHYRAYRNTPLSESQKAGNTARSRIRARVEHIFGFMAGTMGAERIRTIGARRARRGIGLANMVYSMARCVQLRVSFAWKPDMELKSAPLANRGNPRSS